MDRFSYSPSGPERDLERAVVSSLAELFPPHGSMSWIAGSLPIGAGNPDILVASSRPELTALAGAKPAAADVVAYLRNLSGARVETIASRLSCPRRRLVATLDQLVSSGIVTLANDVYALRPAWRNILTEVTTIEVKVSDWRSAVAQAVRNSIFAHHTYVAMPERIALRVAAKDDVRGRGIGILGIDEDGAVACHCRSKRSKTSIWQYYYLIAIAMASNVAQAKHALRSLH